MKHKKKDIKEASADRNAVKLGHVRQIVGAEIYLVKSDGGPSWYTVIRWPPEHGDEEASWECRCQAGQHGVPCKHIRRAKIQRAKS